MYNRAKKIELAALVNLECNNSIPLLTPSLGDAADARVKLNEDLPTVQGRTLHGGLQMTVQTLGDFSVGEVGCGYRRGGAAPTLPFPGIPSSTGLMITPQC